MTACPICAYADVHGSWPTSHRGTHCADTRMFGGRTEPGCHRSWKSLVEAHCTVCHLHFTSDYVATVHEPYCTPDHDETLRRCQTARSAAHKPVFAVRDRRDGPVLVRWSPANPEKTQTTGGPV